MQLFDSDLTLLSLLVLGSLVSFARLLVEALVLPVGESGSLFISVVVVVVVVWLIRSSSVKMFVVSRHAAPETSIPSLLYRSFFWFFMLSLLLVRCSSFISYFSVSELRSFVPLDRIFSKSN